MSTLFSINFISHYHGYKIMMMHFQEYALGTGGANIVLSGDISKY